MNLVYELEREIEIENVVIENGYVVDKRTGEVIGRVYVY
jgi:hypothetical protein